MIEMNDDYKFDIDLSQMNVQIDVTDLHSPAEKPSVDMLNSILSSKIEMKEHTKTLITHNLFIEYKIFKNGQMLSSGLKLSEADYYFFNIHLEMGIFLSKRFLVFLFNKREAFNIETKNVRNADNYIGYGLIVPWNRILGMYEIYLEKDKKI